MTDYYVSPSGRDVGVGSIADPFLTVIKGLNTVAAGDRLILRGGIYRGNSGWFPAKATASKPIVLEAYPGEQVTLSALSPITDWQPFDLTEGKAIYRSLVPFTMCDPDSAPGGEDFVTCNGVPVNEAQWPTADTEKYPQKSTSWATVESGAWIASSHSEGALITGQIQDAALTAFPENSLAGSYITLLPGARWALVSGKVLANTGDKLTFAIKSPGSESFYVPDGRSLYFLFGKKLFLSSPGSWWRDPVSKYLYLWLPDSSDPNNSVVEVKKEKCVLDFYARSHYVFKNLTFAGSHFNIYGASNMKFDGCMFKWYTHRLYVDKVWGWVPPALYVSSDNIKIYDCDFVDSFGTIIFPESQQGLKIENCTILNTGGVTFTGMNSKFSNNTVDTCPGGCFKLLGKAANTEISYNEFGRSGTIFTDGGIFLIAGHCTGEGRIFRNYLHDGYAPTDETKQFYGTAGIYFESDISNFVFHHNIICRTSSPGISLVANGGGKKLENIEFYNNTCDATLYWIPTWAENPTYKGVDFSNNYFRQVNSGTGYHPDIRFSRNCFKTLPDFLKGTNNISVSNPDFTNDYSLKVDSPLRSVGQLVLETTTDSFPDIGAREGIQWTPGATVRSSDILLLAIENYRVDRELIIFTIANLPFGRHLGENFKIKLGSGGESSGTIASYSPTAGQTVWARTEPGDWVAIGQINLPPVLQSLSANKGKVGTAIRLIGENFNLGSSVWFDGTEVLTDYIDANQLEVIVPFGVVAENLQVQVFNLDGQYSSVLEFSIARPLPAIVSTNPNPVQRGQTLMIAGENFGVQPYVFFGKLKVTPIACTESQLQVIVPLSVAIGTLQVKVSNETGSSLPIDITVRRMVRNKR